MRLTACVLLASGLLVGCASSGSPEGSAAAADMSAGATAQTKTAAAKKPRLICVEEHAVGSNRKERVCMTKEEMQARTADSKEQLRRQRSRGADTSVSSGPGG